MVSGLIIICFIDVNTRVDIPSFPKPVLLFTLVLILSTTVPVIGVKNKFIFCFTVKGSCQIKKIQKSEKNSDSPDCNHIPHPHLIFLKIVCTVKKKHKKHSISKKYSHLSWGLIYPPTSEFFSKF